MGQGESYRRPGGTGSPFAPKRSSRPMERPEDDAGAEDHRDPQRRSPIGGSRGMRAALAPIANWDNAAPTPARNPRPAADSEVRLPRAVHAGRTVLGAVLAIGGGGDGGCAPP